MKKACRTLYRQQNDSPDARNCSYHPLGATDRRHSAAAAVLIMLSMCASARSAAPPPSGPDASGYEISIGELNKVKKERPQKKEPKERRNRKSQSQVQQPSAAAVVLTGKVDPAPAAATAAASRLLLPAAPVTISHDPYSYVITGKRTILQVVISSTASTQAVYCRFRATEEGAYALVPMLQAAGTRFTYAATLPGLAAASRSLRYSIVAVDSAGHEDRSQEYVIAVKPSAVLPGWQAESSPEPLKIRLENREKPLEGFSDPGMVVE